MDSLYKEELLPRQLPELGSILHEAKKIASSMTIGKTLFMEKHGVNSEAEYKLKRMKEGRVMRHAHIGWNSWEETSKGFLHIYKELADRDVPLDRFGVCLDWTMGVPKRTRCKLSQGTGLIFTSPEEWNAVGRVVPVQPHFGDHMIGSPNSVENVRLALEAGATTIGNVSQFYTYEYPGLWNQEKRVVETVKALAIMAEFKSKGAIVHSNLDDGFGSHFHDLANLSGWAMIEAFIVKDLVGARLGHCFGNLFADPVLRIIFSLVIDEIHHGESIGTMVYGDTIDYTTDYDRNFGILSSFLLADVMAQIYKPTGHAISPIPITEGSRIPTPGEIIQAQVISKSIEDKARDLVPFINWDRILEEKEKLLAGGRVFFERILNALDEVGIDIHNSAELLLALKRTGAAILEEYFGAGEKDDSTVRKRVPILPTDILKAMSQQQRALLGKIRDEGQSLSGVKVVAASTDVHEFGKQLVAFVLREAGAEVYDIGTGVDPKEVVKTTIETGSQFIAISTYSGIALSYARKLLGSLESHNLAMPIFMGGLLKENQKGDVLAVDVRKQLKGLGIICCSSADQILQEIKERI